MKECSESGTIHRKRNLKCEIFLFTSLTISFIYTSVVFLGPNDFRSLSIKVSNFYRSDGNDTVILLYSKTDMFALKSELKQQYFESIHCPVTSCVITNDRFYLSNVIDFDALVFWAHDRWKTYEYPSIRGENQIYVMAMLESPFHVQKTFKYDSKLINRTMTYRLDSDILWSYGSFYEKATQRQISPSVSPDWGQEINDELFDRPFLKNQTIIDLVRNKTKQAAWFVSNCQTPSKRAEVAKSLSQYISVDIFGRCGPFKCSRADEGECRRELEIDYKFYLSFENSLCIDYVTEKIFANMNYFIIPVVYGGADYSRFFPPHSYINVQDFKSTKDLSDYLWYLSEHPEEYIKYFWWKEFYYIKGFNFCDLCVKMSEFKSNPQPNFYTDIDKWYRNGKCSTNIPIKLGG